MTWGWGVGVEVTWGRSWQSGQQLAGREAVLLLVLLLGLLSCIPVSQPRGQTAVELRRCESEASLPSLPDCTAFHLQASRAGCVKLCARTKALHRNVCLDSGTASKFVLGFCVGIHSVYVGLCVPAGQERLMESALLLFAQLAVYVMGVLMQYMGTIHGLLQVGGCILGMH